jgi:hypothetical protein
MYGMINDQENNKNHGISEQDADSDRLRMTNIQMVTQTYPIMNKSENEIRDIDREEKINEFLNTNETNESLFKNMDKIYKYHIDGSELEDQYERVINLVKDLIKRQKIDGNYISVKWLKEVLFKNKSEFEKFVKDVRNLEVLLKKYNVEKNIPILLRQLERSKSEVPSDLMYRIDALVNLIKSMGVPKPTGPRPS